MPKIFHRPFFSFQDPQCEFLTFETIQTYRGHKPDRTIVMKEKHDMVESEAQKSPCAQRFLRSGTNSASETPNGYLSSSEKSSDGDQKMAMNGIQKSAVNGNRKTTLNGVQKSTNGVQVNGVKKSETEKKTTIDETDAPKKRVTIVKNSLTPPVSSSSTPQRVRRSQSLSSTRLSTFSEFEKSCLKAHNDCRTKHAVPPLKLSKRLCRFAEEWAKVCEC